MIQRVPARFTKFALCCIVIPLVLTCGCEDKSSVVATYSGSFSSANEEVTLFADGHYKQSFQYYQKLPNHEGLPGHLSDFPIQISQKDQWKLIDAQTGNVVQINNFSKSDMDHMDVELINAIGPAPLEENKARHINYNRTINATEFHLVNLP